MAEENDKGASDAPTRRTGLLSLYSLAAVLAAIAGFSSIILFDRLARDNVTGQPVIASVEAASEKPHESGLAKLVEAESPKPIVDITFTDGDGAQRRLSDFRGKVILLNLWATWCAPCKIEMPGLNRLEGELGGSDFTVLPISLDFGGPAKPKRFLETNNLDNLGFYQGEPSKLTQHFGAPGLPFTLLIDREGREIARLAGMAEWDSHDAKAIIRNAMKR
ncbi:MAG: TlpA family protein disulfide reductase [Hyphomicrobiales bacterium]|nr:TlpA family protein disulfide reductase [Hyphomicrobiales bacterium]